MFGAIREARADEVADLQDIERSAGRLFAEIGMREIAEDEPLPVDVLERYRAAGHAWVAVDTDDEPIAYIIVEMLDGNAHIEQVSVHPDSSRQGIGGALVERVADWAAEGDLRAITLTTFTDVPWNARYYERLGFRTLTNDQLTPGLRRKRAEEAAHGLDKWRRVCMRRDL
ncbi:MAG: GNAT family N-acetyltransferase [Acidimicrobiia bacterium]